MIPRNTYREVVRRNDIEEIIGPVRAAAPPRATTATGLCPSITKNAVLRRLPRYPELLLLRLRRSGRRHQLCAQSTITSAMSRPSNNWPPAPECPCPRRTTANPAPASVCWKSTAAPRGISTRTSTPKRRRPPCPPLLERSGLSDAAIRRFGLGYAPDDFVGLLHYLKHLGFSGSELETSGLVKRSAKGNLYDIFRHRVMVPHHRFARGYHCLWRPRAG